MKRDIYLSVIQRDIDGADAARSHEWLSSSCPIYNAAVRRMSSVRAVAVGTTSVSVTARDGTEHVFKLSARAAFAIKRWDEHYAMDPMRLQLMPVCYCDHSSFLA